MSSSASSVAALYPIFSASASWPSPLDSTTRPSQCPRTVPVPDRTGRADTFHHFDFHPFLLSALPCFCLPRPAASIHFPSANHLSSSSISSVTTTESSSCRDYSARSSTRTRCSRDFQGLCTLFCSGISASPSLLFVEVSKAIRMHSLTPDCCNQWTSRPTARVVPDATQRTVRCRFLFVAQNSP